MYCVYRFLYNKRFRKLLVSFVKIYTYVRVKNTIIGKGRCRPEITGYEKKC